MVASGSARNTTKARAIASSERWATRSLQCERWRKARAREAGRTADTARRCRLEEPHPLRQELQRQPAADLEPLLGQEVEREIDGDRLPADRLGVDADE